MSYGHGNDFFPSPTRLKKLRELAESELAPRYERELTSQVAMLEAQLEEANKTLNKLADTLRVHRIRNWMQVDSDYNSLKELTK